MRTWAARVVLAATLSISVVGCGKLLAKLNKGQDEAPAMPPPVATQTAVPTATTVATADPPPTAPATADTVAKKAAASAFKIGDKVSVEWKGSWWPATIIGVVAKDRYKIHYDGWGSEWDEVVGPSRMRAKR